MYILNSWSHCLLEIAGKKKTALAYYFLYFNHPGSGVCIVVLLDDISLLFISCSGVWIPTSHRSRCRDRTPLFAKQGRNTIVIRWCYRSLVKPKLISSPLTPSHRKTDGQLCYSHSTTSHVFTELGLCLGWKGQWICCVTRGDGGREGEGGKDEGGRKGRGWREVVGREGGREGGREEGREGGQGEGREGGEGGREGRGDCYTYSNIKGAGVQTSYVHSSIKVGL